MAKRAHIPTMRTVEPVGEITDFPAPVAVQFRLNWQNPYTDRQDHIASGWAIAYTRTEGLVVWRQGEKMSSGWFPAAHIRRVTPGR